jgi:uncharacterized protein (DUF302 family)
MKPNPETRGRSTRYAYGRTLEMPFENALERTRSALLAEGFGVLFELDLRAKLQEKLGVDMRRYVILGACNPPIAHRALLAERDLGLLLPCNVIVYEEDDGRSTVKAIDALQMLSVTGNRELDAGAHEVNERLQKVIEAL